MAVQNDDDVGLNFSGFVELPLDLDYQFIGSKDSKHTKQVVATSVNVLAEYCNKSSGTTLADVEQMTPGELCRFLQSFYSTVRQKDGSFYARSSMTTLRYGLQRHFQKLQQVDIANDAAFKPANKVFNTILSNLKSAVKMSHVRKRNMAKIRSSPATDCSTPRGLQNTVFLDVMLHLCCSSYGRRNLRGMQRSHFEVLTNPVGRRFVCFAVKHVTGHYAEHEIESDESDDDVTVNYSGNFNRMYETPEKPESCPVRCFEKYMSKLNPDCKAFWQRPKLPNKIFSSSNTKCWYDAVPLGKNALGNKMREISAEAGCSIVYTNQCLKVTGKLMNHIGPAGCKAKRANNCYSEAMTSSDDDSSASDNDRQMEDSSSSPQQENDGHIFAVEIGETGQDESEFHVKLEDEMAGNQLVTDPCVRTAQDGMQYVVNAPPITSTTSYPIENPSRPYPSRPYPVNINPNNHNSVHYEGSAASQQSLSQQIPNGIDLDTWAIEISWVDEKNQRKWLLTKKTTTSSPVENAWRRSVELQTQRNTMLTDHSYNEHSQQGPTANYQDLQTPRSATLNDNTCQDHTQQSTSMNLPNQDLGDPCPSLSRSASEMPPHPRLPSSGPLISNTGASQRLVIGGSSGIASKSTGDDQLIQLQKNVLMMQQENLALERQKITLEMAKLEAEKLKLEAERRKLTMEGDKLQRELK